MGSCICLMLVLCFSSNCGTPNLVSNANTIKPDTNNNALKSDETLYYLDLSNPSISQPIEPMTDHVEVARFVRVDVAEVLNPRKYTLTFEVHYQPESKPKIYLGTFSLYPADNPGQFIVPTQGKVKKEGAIVLSLVMVDKVDATAPVKVGVKRIKFLKE
jgi:hypothetical protein